MTEYLFAYGTLQPGLVPESMSALAGKLTPIGKGLVHGVLYDLGRYPGAIPDAASPHQIVGTVLELPDDENILPKLDAYEGFDPASPASSEYIRERQTVKLADGRTLDCWFYGYNWKPDASKAIPSGVWKR